MILAVHPKNNNNYRSNKRSRIQALVSRILKLVKVTDLVMQSVSDLHNCCHMFNLQTQCKDVHTVSLEETVICWQLNPTDTKEIRINILIVKNYQIFDSTFNVVSNAG